MLQEALHAPQQRLLLQPGQRHGGQELPLRTWQPTSPFDPLEVMIKTPRLGVG